METNVDQLKETKYDVFVGSLVLQQIHILKRIVLFNDFCEPSDKALQTFYERIYI